jgi:cell wall-associated NlpC family hydrolase
MFFNPKFTCGVEMQPQTIETAMQHFINEFPREAIGLVVEINGEERYLACTNHALKDCDQFVLSGEEFAAAEDVGAITAVVHSHPNGRAVPSPADRKMCEASGIDRWVIGSVSKTRDGVAVTDWCEFAPCGYRAPLIGRPFVHGVHDCYSIIQDWYAQERFITLPDFERVDGWWETGETSLYLDNYIAAGFEVTEDALLQEGDVLLMTIGRSRTVNHAAVYVGDGKILHHLYGELSRTETFSGKYQSRVHCALRYRSA